MNNVSTDSRSEIDGGPVKLGPSVFWHFRKSLQENADDEAIIVAHQQPDHLIELTKSHTASTVPSATSKPSKEQNQVNPYSCLCWTYQQLHNATINLVAALHQNNIPAGSKIVHLIPNSIEWAMLLWASKLGKFTQSAFDTGLLTAARRVELQTMIQMVIPDVVIVADTEGAVALDQVLETLEASQRPKLKVILSSRVHENGLHTDSNPLEWTCLTQLAHSVIPVSAEKRNSIETEGLHDDLSRISDIMFTSGTTTGQPKGCPRTVAGSLFLIAGQHWGPGCTGKQSKNKQDLILENANPNRPRARIALAGQNFRIIAPSMLTSVLGHGGTLIMPSAHPDLGALISAIPRFKVKSILMIPPGVNAISQHPDFAHLDQSSLESLSLGGDIVTQSIFEKAATIFPNCEIIVSHGMTEGGSAFYYPYLGRPGIQILADVKTGKDTTTTSDDHIIRFHSGIASIGKVNTGTRLKISDDHNNPVPRTHVGELHFNNPSIVRFYLNRVKPEDFYIEDFVDGEDYASHVQWFKSGDLGIVDEDGWVWILGRKKDVIKRMGVSVVPAALENCLNTFLDAETAIIPHPHATLGQVPIAVVTAQALAASGRSKEDVRKHILDHFGRDYALGGVVTIEEMGFSAFPLNATGKIVKRELVEAALAFVEESGMLDGSR